ncbi:Redoxin-domain-containing protein [Gautieria morchelliformis]|nr:Redoxin-domain-containing protein [Gautieria morchelliformis]
MASILTSATTSAADAAHAAAASVLAMSQIKPGASLPDVPVKEDSPEETFSLANLPGKNIIVGVPGAFTPSCSSQVPGYISNYEKFTAKGVQGISVVAVNDVFVTKAWKEKLASNGTPVHFIADDKGAFTSAVGLLFDASPVLGGPRAKQAICPCRRQWQSHLRPCRS